MAVVNLLASDVELSPYYRCHTWLYTLQCLSSDHSTKIFLSHPYTFWYSQGELNMGIRELLARSTFSIQHPLVHKYVVQTRWFLAHLHEIRWPCLRPWLP